MPTITQKRKARQLNSARLKAIRPFVTFNYDLRRPLTKAAKSKIKKYYDEISALQNRPNQVYRPRRADHLAQAQEFAQHETKLPALKVAFIPTDGKTHVDLTFSKKGVRARSGRIFIESVPLSERGLRGDSASYVKGRIAGNSATQFTIQAGRYEIPIPYLPASVPNAVARLVAKYGTDANKEKRRPKSRHWSNWLFGLKAYRFEQQGELQQYLIEKQDAIKDAKRKRKNAKRQKQRIKDRQQR